MKRSRSGKVVIGLCVMFVLALFNLSFAADPPASQQMSGEVSSRRSLDEEERLRKEIGKPKTKAKVEYEEPESVPQNGPVGPKIFIKNINVTGVKIFPEAKIKAITAEYLNKELSLGDIQKVAGLITDLYRKKGFITSRAYVPPQKMEQGNLEIRVVEATVGDIQIKGNRFYSTGLIKRYVSLIKGEAFNYNDLKKDLVDINEHPDRNAKAVLAPGKDPGTTDVILEVKDALPIHVGLGYNNFLSRFVRKNNYNSTFTHNNFLGQDDILTFQYQRGDANDYHYYSIRYLYPVTKSLDIGVFASRSKLVLGREYTDVQSRGKSRIFGVYASQNLIKNDDLVLNLNLGFDYKDVYNFLSGDISSRDKLRVAKAGFDFDLTDNFGRTIITNDFNYGIPGIMGGTKANLGPNDTPTSRAGADGEFLKDTLNILRLQKLLFDMTLLWKNQFQFSPSTLTATEQFQVGGPANNRGYPPAEYVGDRGYAMSWELALPPYFVPKFIKVPLSKSRVYDAVRFVAFYDWTNVHLKSLQAGDRENRTLRSAGCGVRINIAENLFARYEIGWPLDQRPSDGKNVHQWFEITKTF
ncbi:MAG: ShlB/FhaC/HecB family hemolysin secretion/activation protein [Candidatus Omnitrophota bacterium]